jgi:hypothetical protein
MSLVLKLGATLTGGTDTTLVPDVLTNNGKSRWVFPTHTQLEPRVLLLGTKEPVVTSQDPGVSTATAQLVFTDRVSAEEGCCNVQQGSAAVNIEVKRWLNQPDALVDEVVSATRAFVYTSAFVDMIKKGVRPS